MLILLNAVELKGSNTRLGCGGYHTRSLAMGHHGWGTHKNLRTIVIRCIENDYPSLATTHQHRRKCPSRFPHLLKGFSDSLRFLLRQVLWHLAVSGHQQRPRVALPHGSGSARVVEHRPAQVVVGVADPPELAEADAVVLGAQPEAAGRAQQHAVVTSEDGMGWRWGWGMGHKEVVEKGYERLGR